MDESLTAQQDYAPLMTTSNQLWTCLRCGAVVGVRTIHDAWHEAMVDSVLLGRPVRGV